MNETKRDLIFWCIILISILFLVFIYFNYYFKPFDSTILDSLCQNISYEEHFGNLQGFTLFTSYQTLSTHLKNFTTINENLTTYYCEADMNLCIDGLRMCFRGSLYSDERNYTKIG